MIVDNLTVHCPLNRHLSIIGQKDQSHCDRCGVRSNFVAPSEEYVRERNEVLSVEDLREIS